MSWRDWLPPYRPGGQPPQPQGVIWHPVIEVPDLTVDDGPWPDPDRWCLFRPIFDWARDCPDDFATRTWPAVAGRGRGTPYEPSA